MNVNTNDRTTRVTTSSPVMPSLYRKARAILLGILLVSLSHFASEGILPRPTYALAFLVGVVAAILPERRLVLDGIGTALMLFGGQLLVRTGTPEGEVMGSLLMVFPLTRVLYVQVSQKYDKKE